MLKLIVGLGNPGQQYEKTRHNAGFLFLDSLVKHYQAKWNYEKRFQGQLACIAPSGHKVWLLKPETFMNRSGRSVKKLVDFYKLVPEETLVVHDELDFKPGVIKLKRAGGHAGHNGLRDIIACLGSNAFWRIRIGIGRPETAQPVADYVLSRISDQDALLIKASISSACGEMDLLIDGEMERFMARLH